MAAAHKLDDLKIDRSSQSERSFPLWIVVVLLLVVCVGAAGFYFFNREPVLEVKTVAVREIQASAGSQRTVLNASGYVTARRQATVSSKVTGKITEVLIEEGMKVETGQVLARLDDSNVNASLQLAIAQLESAKAALEETRVRLNEAELEFNRTTQLAETGISSTSELDRTRAEVESLKARLLRLDKDIEVATQQVNLSKQQMEDMIVRAPFAGVVISKDAQPGEMISPVSAGSGFTRTGVCTIVDMSSLEIEVDVNESFINRVESGQPVEATLDAYSDWKIPASVIAIIPAADRQKATVKVRIGFDELDPRILPDMGVKVAFQAGEEEASTRKTAYVIPSSALRKDAGRDIVFIINDGLAERRAIQAGGTNGTETTVIAGLALGERVIADPPQTLQDGSHVKETTE